MNKSVKISFQGDYAEWMRFIKERVRQAQLRALLAVNTEQLLLYWDIGREILEKQEHFGWGAKIVDRMAGDLRVEFPDMSGFSSRNLKYMRAFSDSWRRDEIVQAPLAQLPWYHQIALMEKLKSRTDRLAYASLAVENGWSRNVLVHHVELGTAKSSARPSGFSYASRGTKSLWNTPWPICANPWVFPPTTWGFLRFRSCRSVSPPRSPTTKQKRHCNDFAFLALFLLNYLHHYLHRAAGAAHRQGRFPKRPPQRRTDQLVN